MVKQNLRKTEVKLTLSLGILIIIISIIGAKGKVENIKCAGCSLSAG